MTKTHRGKRRILSAGIGIAAITALGGLACGNPVEPGCGPGLTCVDAPPVDAGPIDGAELDAAAVDAAVTDLDAAAAVPQP